MFPSTTRHDDGIESFDKDIMMAPHTIQSDKRHMSELGAHDTASQPEEHHQEPKALSTHDGGDGKIASQVNKFVKNAGKSQPTVPMHADVRREVSTAAHATRPSLHNHHGRNMHQKTIPNMRVI